MVVTGVHGTGAGALTRLGPPPDRPCPPTPARRNLDPAGTMYVTRRSAACRPSAKEEALDESADKRGGHPLRGVLLGAPLSPEMDRSLTRAKSANGRGHLLAARILDESSPSTTASLRTGCRVTVKRARSTPFRVCLGAWPETSRGLATGPLPSAMSSTRPFVTSVDSSAPRELPGSSPSSPARLLWRGFSLSCLAWGDAQSRSR
jgi:hypothetical protein